MGQFFPGWNKMLNGLWQALFAKIVKLIKGAMGQIHDQQLVKEDRVKRGQVFDADQIAPVLVAFRWIFVVIVFAQPL